VLVVQCPNDKNSWLEVQDKFDTDGELHLAVNEWYKGKEAFREQCVYMSRDQVIELVQHLKKALNDAYGIGV
jgi:hypothetical protein